MQLAALAYSFGLARVCRDIPCESAISYKKPTHNTRYCSIEATLTGLSFPFNVGTGLYADLWPERPPSLSTTPTSV